MKICFKRIANPSIVVRSCKFRNGGYKHGLQTRASHCGYVRLGLAGKLGPSPEKTAKAILKGKETQSQIIKDEIQQAP